MSADIQKCPKCEQDLTKQFNDWRGSRAQRIFFGMMRAFMWATVMALPTLLFAWAYRLVFR